MSSAWRRYLPGGLLVVLLAVFLGRLLFTNLILGRGDTFFYFYPYWAYRAEMLRAWQLPLWNPYLFMGAPFLANIQAGVLYPLNWPLNWFDAPQAVKLSIAIHLLLAAVGAWRLARETIGVGETAALGAALVFAAGGYMAGKVEQINQLQGLAWLPWQLWLLSRLLEHPHPRRVGWLALVIALQLLAGHTQTTFISIVAMGLWLLAGFEPSAWRRLPVQALLLGAAGLLAGLLTAAQLLPTAELSALSFRSGGLSANEAVSFSLHPLALGRALLPGYTRGLFTEYVAYIGVAGLLLLVPGVAVAWRTQRRLLLLGGSGLLLALGGYTPLYWVLVWVVPGFDLFRVPARWLVLWALAAALLVGLGLDHLKNHRSRWWWGLPLVVALATLALAAFGLTPAGEAGPLGLPGWRDALGWGLALAAGLAVQRWQARIRHAPAILVGVVFAELLVAAQVLPLNRLTAPEAWTAVRPAMTQLLIDDGQPPGRFLSMSALLFDPGDLSELDGIWAPQLSDDGLFYAIVATKAREVLSPNLGLAWHVPGVDGFDGGILPLRSYATFTQAFTGSDTPSPDGRLREYVTETPPNWLLNATNTRWLIADKVGDAWIDDVFYDLQFSETLDSGQSIAVGYVPPFAANALGLVVETGAPAGTALLEARVAFADGSTRALTLRAGDARVRWDEAAELRTLTLVALQDGVTLRGLSLIDERSGAFQALAPGPYRLAHSGDVKVYENLAVWPRAFFVERLPLDAASAVVPAEITHYSAGQVVVQVQAPVAGYLVLSDAHYPGWRAWVDGQPVAIETANGLFRAVAVTAGTRAVRFGYEPASLRWGAALSALGLVVLLVLLVWPVAATSRRAGLSVNPD